MKVNLPDGKYRIVSRRLRIAHSDPDLKYFLATNDKGCFALIYREGPAALIRVSLLEFEDIVNDVEWGRFVSPDVYRDLMRFILLEAL